MATFQIVITVCLTHYTQFHFLQVLQG